MASPSEHDGSRRRLNFPDRFRNLRVDADEDVRPPSQGPSMFMNMNQSIFGLIAAAGSNVDFNDRFEGQSSDEDDNNEDGNGSDIKDKGKKKQREQVAKTTILKPSSSSKEKDTTDEKHRRGVPRQLLQSLPQLPRIATRSLSQRSKLPKSSHTTSKNDPEHRTSTPPITEPQSPNAETGTAGYGERLAPVMSRMLDARAEMSSRPSFDLEGLSRDLQTAGDETGPSALARKLKEIFEFDNLEEVVEEYPCWFLQSVLLQGYMYITSRHVCFYAYLPRKAQEVVKSGYLSKSGKRNPKYNRYWFRLKGDVLAYYRDASNLYFPHGQIDLRYAISAAITDKDQDAVHFSVATHHRTYHFRADSAPSAKEWVRSLQRVIFQSHNEGDSVKISLPIENILDVEDSQIIEFADTCKLRVIDNDETFSIDEYFFSFFSFGKEAINVLKILVEDSSRQHSGDAHQDDAQQTAVGATSDLRSNDKSPKLHENVKATFSPRSSRTHRDSSPRLSNDIIRDASRQSGRGSLDSDHHRGVSGSRRSFSGCRSPGHSHQYDSSTSQGNRASSDSYVQSLEDPSLHIDAAGDDEGDIVDGNHTTAMERFRAHFALPETEKLQATYFGFLIRVLPLYGKVYISDRNFCFRSLLPGTRTKLILPLKDIETADKEMGFRFGYSGLVVVIRGHEELFFEFSQADVRDDCAVTLLHSLEAKRLLGGPGSPEEDLLREGDEALAERDALNEARLLDGNEHELKMPQEAPGLSESSPTILFDDPKASFLNFKPSESLKITCLTIGSRGDVQPYIALCKGLIADGHKPRIATHTEFRDWIEGHGIEFAPVEGDPSELLRVCIENGTFTWAFLREANSNFRGWLDGLLASAYTACQGSDLLIESPSAMAGIHIAEALNIPYFRAFTMPWTRTRAYPHAFIVPEHKMGGAYNYITYVMFDNVFWKATAHQVNRWRNTMLGLPNTNLEKMQPNKVPFLYNFSPAVVAPPLDYSDWIRVTGYWFLDEGQDWTPPDDLREFISKARRDGKRLVYVGFGSIIVPDPAKMTQEVIDGVLKADVRCILSKGWSDRLDKTQASVPEHALPPEIFQIKSAPHDWLFRQIDAAAHHGGSGTTGASLRAGIPTIIRPFFGDQFFFGNRVEDLGVGICLKKWGANSFAKALWEATHSDRMIVKARVLGETIRREDGVGTAIQSIYRDLEYAKSLVASKAGKNAVAASGPIEPAGGDDSEEESWTFVGGDEIDPELVVKKSVLAEMEANINASGLLRADTGRPVGSS
ncbi:hypothetical protein ONZ43_g4781 [Nemania bipapillata]|uniref:Uncharacterized protein n=1 Tax=Nemania bipapillata TaxID=110536 RepID=A0ACC2IIN4_9PEZI|nr:hypothetical protein ONZ43_g4781 [Nemania bipapillata]